MKPGMNNISLSLVAALALTFVGCGAAQERNQTEQSEAQTAGSAKSVSSNSELSAAAVETVLTDSFESLLTQNSSGASLSLAGDEAADSGDKSVYSRACVVEGDTAKVSISTTMDRSMTKDRPNMSMSRTVSGSSTQTRIWSMTKSGVAVPVLCGPNNKAALIDWSGDLAGMKLDVSFERSRSHSISMTNKKKGKEKTWEHSRSFSASGNRKIEWSAVDAAVTTAIVREKTISSNVNRTVNVTKKDGSKEELAFAVKTSDDAPLKVRVERDKTTKALQKKTIKSGTIVATRNTDGRIESSFSDVVLSFDGKECVGDSGSVVTKFYAEGSAEPVKQLKLTIDGGVYTLTDLVTGEEKGELTEIGCDAEDFAN